MSKYYNRTRYALPIPRDDGNSCLLGSRQVIDMTGQTVSEQFLRFVRQGDLVLIPDAEAEIKEELPISAKVIVEPASVMEDNVETRDHMDAVLPLTEDTPEIKTVELPSIKVDGRSRKNK